MDIYVVELVEHVLINSINHANRNVINYYYVVIHAKYHVFQNFINVKINVKYNVIVTRDVLKSVLMNVYHVKKIVNWNANILIVQKNAMKYVIENHVIKNVTKYYHVVVIAWDFVEKFVLKYVKLIIIKILKLIKILSIIN